MSASQPPIYAGFVSRAVALVVDGLIMQGVALAVTAIVALVLTALLPDSVKVDLPALLATAGAWAIFAAAYLVGFWALVGQTPGMRLMGLVLHSADGQRVGLARALRRLLGMVASVLSLGLGFLLVLVDDRRRALPDRLAGTLVVYANSTVEPQHGGQSLADQAQTPGHEESEVPAREAGRGRDGDAPSVATPATLAPASTPDASTARVSRG